MVCFFPRDGANLIVLGATNSPLVLNKNTKLPIGFFNRVARVENESKKPANEKQKVQHIPASVSSVMPKEMKPTMIDA